jgi:predicted DNA-binding protein with PD1-like motif
MTVRAHRSERARHLVLRLSAGETLPDALAEALREEQVSCGWLRASGVIADVELRAFDGQLRGLGSTRRVPGPVHVLALEGGIGMAQGEPSVSLRALFAREGDHGLETFAGEVVGARTVALEAFVTVLDDVSIERGLDEGAGVWLFGGAGATPGSPSAPRPKPTHAAPVRPQPPTPWSSALEASEDEPHQAHERPPVRPASPGVPPRPMRPLPDLDAPTPEGGDVVDHFAFGRCDVLKSDGDRLHLRVHKDGRIREIALEMLRVTRLEDSGGKRRFKLERRM